MGTDMQISRWGNSLGVRLPAAVVKALELKPGDEIEIRIAGRRSFEVRRKADVLALLEQLRRYRGLIPPDFTFDRAEIYRDRLDRVARPRRC
jgi:antitoxin MazE